MGYNRNTETHLGVCIQGVSDQPLMFCGIIDLSVGCAWHVTRVLWETDVNQVCLVSIFIFISFASTKILKPLQTPSVFIIRLVFTQPLLRLLNWQKQSSYASIIDRFHGDYLLFLYQVLSFSVFVIHLFAT